MHRAFCSFGNGQFACLILCLTMTDLLTTLCGVMGGLILEVGDMSWAGSSQGCAAYYFISSWVVGLSNYLVVCLVCLLLVKRAPGVLARLQECKLLLLSLVLLSLLPATPELAIRGTVTTGSHYFCIYTTNSATYALYVTFKLILRHILPAVLILLCILRPRTVVAKRLSLILMGPPAVCECGPSGSVLSTPHECPKMARSRPDILRDTEAGDLANTEQMIKHQKLNGHSNGGIPALVEDPVRRTYKKLLAISFIFTCSLHILLDLIFQVNIPRRRLHDPYLDYLLANITLLLADPVSCDLELPDVLRHPRGGGADRVQARGQPGHRPLHHPLHSADHQPSDIPLLRVRGQIATTEESGGDRCTQKNSFR